mgnify:CR=1 FL=1
MTVALRTDLTPLASSAIMCSGAWVPGDCANVMLRAEQEGVAPVEASIPCIDGSELSDAATSIAEEVANRVELLRPWCMIRKVVVAPGHVNV